MVKMLAVDLPDQLVKMLAVDLPDQLVKMLAADLSAKMVKMLVCGGSRQGTLREKGEDHHPGQEDQHKNW